MINRECVKITSHFQISFKRNLSFRLLFTVKELLLVKIGNLCKISCVENFQRKCNLFSQRTDINVSNVFKVNIFSVNQRKRHHAKGTSKM